jgi:DNA repair exonuclease SbcCD ATPase subunit
MLSVASRVNTLENRSNELKAKLTECKSSYKGVSNLFDQVEKQCKTNTRNIIHFDSRIKKLEEKPVVQPVIQPVVESEEIKSLKEIVKRKLFSNSKWFASQFVCVVQYKSEVTMV